MLVFFSSYTKQGYAAFLDPNRILQESFVVALSANHRLAVRSQIPLQSLKDEPLILPPIDAMPLMRQIAAVWRRADLKNLSKPASADSVLLHQFLEVVQATTENEGIPRQ